MKNRHSTRLRFPIVASLALAALFLGGCLDKRLIWAPDGSRAAVIAKDGLYLCGPDGTVTGLLAPGVYAAAWVGDAQHLVLAQGSDLKDWASIVSAVGPARADEIAAKSESLWRQLHAGRSPEEVMKNETIDLTAEVVYLEEHHADDLHKLLGKDWDESQGMTATLNSLVAARVTGDRIEIGPVLYRELAGIADIRPAPGGQAVAFVTGMEPNVLPTTTNPAGSNRDFRILVAPIDGSAPPLLVAEHTAECPDWMADGRRLAYLQASGGGGGDELRLGALVQRPVLDAVGRIHLAEVALDQEQVGLILEPLSRVRCLRDGRIIFNATEFHLPVPKSDQPAKEQLFVLTPSQPPTVRPLISTEQRKRMAINLLPYFEVSPDETQVLVGGDSGEVWLVTPAADRVEQISVKPLNNNLQLFAPVWRRAGEFTYERAAPATPGLKTEPPIEVVQRRNGGETILNRNWPSALMDQFIYAAKAGEPGGGPEAVTPGKPAL